ncbi:MAG: EamA family transporter [Anaerovoracaceae bacterium]|jgi:drug/metabolite transporter (DMT)-like permease/8-oxo-dGTP pyrophosphatase MutT (NUDIX family)
MKKVVFCVCMTALLFGTMEVALKLSGRSIDSVQMTCIRFLIGGVILLPFAAKEIKDRNTHIDLHDIFWMLLLGTVGIAISMLCFQLGVMRSNAATAAALFCLNPLFTMVIADLFTSEKMTRLKWMSFGLGLIAAFFMIRPWQIQEGNTVVGVALMLFAAVTFSIYTVMGKRSIGRLGTFTQTSISFILGSLELFIVLAVTGRPIISGIAEHWAAFAYCGIVVTGLGYMFYFIAIRYSDASTGSIAFFIKPAIAPVLAVLILGETVKWNTIVGIIILITASFLTLYDTVHVERIEDEEYVGENELDVIFSGRQSRAADVRRYFACVIPLVMVDGKDCLLFEIRSKGELHIPGEICFPGGEMQPGEAPEQCVRREASEELGLDNRGIRIISQMDTYHGVTGVKIYCFVGRIDESAVDTVLDTVYRSDEVREVFTVPAEFFIENDPHMHHLDVIQRNTDDTLNDEIGVGERGYDWYKGRRDIPVYSYDGHSIWGVTAILIKDFVGIVRNARKKRRRSA